MFIAFEGCDGSGKSTQVAMLAEHLQGRGEPVLVTREPGGTDLGKSLRGLLLHGEENDPRAEILLFAADRAQHVGRLVRPALDGGRIVITDRYIDSSLAYQGANHADASTLGAIEAISMWATRDLLPDLTVVLDIPPEVGLARGRGTPDTMESRTLTYHRAVREGFLQMAGRAPERYLVVNAMLRPEAVASTISDEVDARLMKRVAA